VEIRAPSRYRGDGYPHVCWRLLLTDALFSVDGFITNDEASPNFTATSMEEALLVFDDRVKRGHVEVTIWEVAGRPSKFVKGFNK